MAEGGQRGEGEGEGLEGAQREEGHDGGWISWGWAWAHSAMQYAQSAVNSAMGWEELEVVEPREGVGESWEGRDEERKAMWETLRNYVGADVMSIFSVPAWVMEPLSTLQKMAEIMEYSHLLDEAAEKPHSSPERAALVAAFATSVYAASERTYKPFNPILGETFELVPREGVFYIAEQVSHHPPIAAASAKGPSWEYDITSMPTTRFWGNSVEVHPLGRTRIGVGNPPEIFSLHPPANKVHNLLIGRTWVDAFGTMEVASLSGGCTASLCFKPARWFGSNRYEVAGSVISPSNEVELSLRGKWNAYLEQRADPNSDWHLLWQASEKPSGDVYGFTDFARKLNSASSAPKGGLLPSDSRFRPDRAALESGDTASASRLKSELEEDQREERRQRGSSGDSFSPRWFHPAGEPAEGCGEEGRPWRLSESYLRDDRPNVVPADSSVDVFCPWQYSQPPFSGPSE